MARCGHRGNECDQAFTVMTADGRAHTFDGFECAIHALAPACGHRGRKIIGHGVRKIDGRAYCRASCASRADAAVDLDPLDPVVEARLARAWRTRLSA